MPSLKQKTLQQSLTCQHLIKYTKYTAFDKDNSRKIIPEVLLKKTPFNEMKLIFLKTEKKNI